VPFFACDPERPKEATGAQGAKTSAAAAAIGADSPTLLGAAQGLVFWV